MFSYVNLTKRNELCKYRIRATRLQTVFETFLAAFMQEPGCKLRAVYCSGFSIREGVSQVMGSNGTMHNFTRKLQIIAIFLLFCWAIRTVIIRDDDLIEVFYSPTLEKCAYTVFQNKYDNAQASPVQY